MELDRALTPGGDTEGKYFCVSSRVIRQELCRRGLYTPSHNLAVEIAFFFVDP